MGRAYLIDEQKYAAKVADLWRLRQERTAVLIRKGGPPIDEVVAIQKKIQALCDELAH